METQKALYRKEGQITESISAIIKLVTGVGVAVVVLIFVGVLGGQTYNLSEPNIEELTTSVVNESVTVLNSTAVTLSNDNVVTNSMTILNNSNTVALTKFTIDYDLGTVELLDNAFNNTALDISYTYGDAEIENSIKNGIISGFNALEQTGDYLPIIVLAVVIALVLLLVLGMNFGNRTGGAARSAL